MATAPSPPPMHASWEGNHIREDASRKGVSYGHGINMHENSSTSIPSSRVIAISHSRPCSASSSQSATSLESAITDVFPAETSPQLVTTFGLESDLLDETPRTQLINKRLSFQKNTPSSSIIRHIEPGTISLVHPESLRRPRCRQGIRFQYGQRSVQKRRPKDTKMALMHNALLAMPAMSAIPNDQWLIAQRFEIGKLCYDLVTRFRGALQGLPGANYNSSNPENDPLHLAARLLNQTVSRLRFFLYNLEPMSCLCWRDRNSLYAAHLCTTTILCASASADLASSPSAYPLPYGETLGKVEALHLVLAHDLYNELRTLVKLIQSSQVPEFSGILLIVMVVFFTPLHTLEHPDRVARIHDYYMHKLQLKDFSARLREFLDDVTGTGLRKQYESVSENLGLLALLLQSECPRATSQYAVIAQDQQQTLCNKV